MSEQLDRVYTCTKLEARDGLTMATFEQDAMGSNPNSVVTVLDIQGVSIGKTYLITISDYSE